MNNFLYLIRRNRYFLLFIAVFAYIQSIQIRFLVRKAINIYTFTPEAAIANFISACFLFGILFLFLKHRKTGIDNKRSSALKIFIISIALYLLCINCISFMIACLFNTLERNFTRQAFSYGLIRDLMNALIYGSFYMVYHYFRENRDNQKKITEYNQALSEMKIQQLRVQMNPHFLFNNLNVLDQLIEEDKYAASDFLNEFADLYRYVLQATDKELVPIHEELEFAAAYFRLMNHKYENRYFLDTNIDPSINGYIIPLTLQLLLENVFKHNKGSIENPVWIRIHLNSRLTVQNNINLKQFSDKRSGRALDNLKKQYHILSGESIHIHHTENEFSVSIPIIKNNNR